MRAASRGLVGLLLAGVAGLPGANEAPRREWNFTVYLDDKHIGAHRFAVEPLPDGGTELVTEATFDVRILFVNAYRYRHRNTERWRGDCLAAIEAHTDDNGDETRVAGAMADDAFVVTTPAGEQRLPACVMTFAYWNPDVLGQAHLLNSQTGEFLPVTVESLGQEPVAVRGRDVPARRYAIDAGSFRIDLWYSAQDEWLALETTTEGGRRLRYRIE